MGRNKLKRFAALRFWGIPVKAYKWVVKPSPGPHRQDACIPLAVLLRDRMKLASTMREVKYMLRNKMVKIDGKPRTDPSFPIGLFDVIYIKGIEKYYRMVPSKRKYLDVVEIAPAEAEFKLVKIVNKTTIKGGIMQLNLHDGRNILVAPEESAKYPVHGSLKIKVPSQEIVEYVPLEKGSLAVISAGRHVGEMGVVEEIFKPSPLAKWQVTLRADEGKTISTIREYVYAVGKDSPVLTVVAQ